MPRWMQTLLIACVVIMLLLAVYQLLLLQYESGDAYPPFSSYRADPLGTLAFYEALGSLPGTTTTRNLTDLNRAEFAPGSTLLFAGGQLSEDYVSTLERLEAHAQQGGRLVILFESHSVEPEYIEEKPVFFEEVEDENSDEETGTAPTEEEFDQEEIEVDPESNEDDESPPDMMDVLAPTEDIGVRWGFGYGYDAIDGDDGDRTAKRVDRDETAPEGLPASLSWHSGLFLKNLDEEWNVVYAHDHRKVVIERAWGAGRIVLVTDNYLATNEAMLMDRQPELLAWLVGNSLVVIFDETHLGVAERTGLMGLLRHYRLVPVLVVSILLVLLFIWKSAASLVPRSELAHGDAVRVDGHSTVSGMARLARRAVPPAQVLDTCWKMYREPAMKTKLPDERVSKAVERLIETNRQASRTKRDPVSNYNRISAMLNERKPHS